MVRGRRKTESATKTSRVSTEEGNNSKATKTEFNGKLSHNSTSASITRFFPPRVPESVAHSDSLSAPAVLTVVDRISPIKHASTMSAVQANSVSDSQIVVESQNGPIPHKIEVHPSALSALTSQCPQKYSKTKKRPTYCVKTVRSPLSNRSVNDNHKLTEYFPVRRSIRKTKKIVLEEKQRHLKEAVQAKQEDGLEIRTFEGKGRGIVAIRPFYRGQFIVEYAGELITSDEAREREQTYTLDQNAGCYMYYFKHRDIQYCIDATVESDRLGRLVNHSRNGNLITKTVVIDNTPHLVLIAKEDIQPGEEVTYDYGDRTKKSLQHHPWLAT